MKVRVIYNPVAGQRDVHSEIGQVTRLLKQRGWEVDAAETHYAGEAKRYAQEAVERGYRLVFSVGGDGTLNEVVNGIVGSEVAVGILPTGTGNVFAKEIGIPTSSPLHASHLIEAVKSLDDGCVYRVDTGLANERYFLLWTGIGFDAQIVHDVEPRYDVKRRWGPLAFVAAGVNLALTFVGTRATVTLDGRTFRERVVLILVSNTRKYGGGLLRPAPKAYLDDGYFDVFVFEGYGPIATLHHTFGMLTEQHLRDPHVSYHRVQCLKIETSKPLAVHVDGVPGGQTPLEIRLLPQSLKVVMPRNVRKDLFWDREVQGIPLQEFLRG